MDDFFKILNCEALADGSYTCTVGINPEHEIFRGHFPGKPVVPGVTTLMMARRGAEVAKGLGKTRIASVKDAKYVAPIVPDGSDVIISFTIDDELNVRADVRSPEGGTYTKLRMQLCN